MQDRREHVNEIVEVLGTYVAKRDDLENRENLRVAAECLRLMNEERPAASDLEQLIRDLDQLPLAGMMTIDLKTTVTAWAIRTRRAALLRDKR